MNKQFKIERELRSYIKSNSDLVLYIIDTLLLSHTNLLHICLCSTL